MKTKLIVGTSFLTTVFTIVVVLIIFSLTSASLAQAPQPDQETNQGPNTGPDDVIQDGSPAPVEDALNPALAGTAYLHLSGSSFIQMYSDVEYTYYSGGCVYHSAGSATHTFMNLGVILPSGSRIHSLRFYYYDTSASASTLRLRQMNDGDDWTDVATVDSVGTAGLGYVTVSGLDYPVDYLNYSYVLQYQGNVIGSTMRFCGARIGYTPPSVFGVALPYVAK
jgi:hypothetical protein